MEEDEFIAWLDEKLNDKEALRQLTEIEFAVEGKLPISAVLVAADYHCLSHITIVDITGEESSLNPTQDNIRGPITNFSYMSVQVSAEHTYEECKNLQTFEDPSAWDWYGGMYGFLESCREECSHLQMLR